MQFEEVIAIPRGAAVKRKQHRSEREQKRLVKLWQSSGQRPVDFCRQHAISPKTFYHWRKKVTTNLKKKSTVAPVPLENKYSATTTAVEIYFPNGLIVELDSSDLQTQLKEMVQWKLS